MRSSRQVQAAIVLWATGLSYAQQYSFRHYGPAEGLQNLTVLSLVQDGQGFIWIGTEAGLYRYDGTRFRVMGTAEGLPCLTEVQSLHVSEDGAVWANACSKIFRFDGFRFHPAAGISGMLYHSQAMTDGPRGHVIVATGSGLQELMPDSDGSFFARPYLIGARSAGRRTRGILRSGSQLWFGCEDRLCLEANGKVAEFGLEFGLPPATWSGIGISPDGTVWARSDSKLYRRLPGSSQFQPEAFQLAPSMYWGALTVGTDGTLMIPTDKGVAIRQNGRWSVIGESQGLRTSLTSAVLSDREGSLWIGLAGAGLARWVGHGEWESWSKAQGLPSNLIWNILRDRKGALWVGTGMGLTQFDGPVAARSWGRKNGLAGDNVRWLGETTDGAIWLITRPGGLSRIDPITGKVRPVARNEGLDCQSPARGLVDHAGRLWVAAETGVFRNDSPASADRFFKINSPDTLEKGAWSIAEDHQHTIWVVSPDGLWRLKDTHWRRYQKSDGLLGDNPYIVVVAPDNSLYLRHRFDPGVERVEFNEDRIVHSTVIVPSGSATVEITAFHGFDATGNFWRGTANGAAVLRDGVWTQFSAEDGLVWNDCDGEAFWADSDGSVWLGTSGGLSRFHPRSKAVAVAEPVISSLEVVKRPRLVRAAFSSLSFRYEQLTQFGYRLDDEPWAETVERSISIAGMDPGWHRLEIRSRIRDGPYSAKLAVAEFYVAPRWWESWWFRGIAFLGTCALAFGIAWWRHWLLRQRNISLEHAVRERTAELEAERVKVLEEKGRADAASEAKGLFLANMSHEIRTPLNGLLGLTALLGDTNDPSERQETVRLICSSGQTLLRVINDVLDFSKVEAGKLELEVAPFQLHSTLAEGAALFRKEAAEKELLLRLALSPGLPEWVAGDETRLRQVVLNLISNALKFTNSGEIVLSAALGSQDQTSHLIGIEVRDTGIGIAPDRLRHLFSSFSQADSSISRRYGGTGLGLAISKRLVELMGGAISVESEPGVGSTFRFTLRLGRATAPAPIHMVGAYAHDNYNLKVLLAEDNEVNQKVSLTLLQRLGIVADTVENGAQAISAAVRSRYDLILMDVQMPDVDGISATHEIRNRADHQPYICALSAHATTDFRDQCLKAGMDGYLTKPLDFKELRRLLEELSGKGGLSDAASPAAQSDARITRG